MATKFTDQITSGLELKLLGLPALYWHNQEIALPSSKAFALLVYVSLHDRSFSRKELSELLWQTTSSANLRVALSELRSLPEADTWLETPDQLVKANLRSDVRTFEEHLAQFDYQKALNLWDDASPFLMHFDLKKADDFMNWLELERSRLNELYLEALEGVIPELEKQDDFSKALYYAEKLLKRDQLNENVWRTAIRLEHIRGDTEKALEQFEQMRLLLKKELDVEPLPETLALLAEIEQGGVSTGKSAQLVDLPNDIPMKPAQLFGREALLEAIDQTLTVNKLCLLQGFGGTGKSALAASYAEVFLKQHQGKLLWLQAGDDPPETLFEAIARAFDARQQLSQVVNKSKVISDLLKNISLFILDDAWNAYALSKLIEVLPKDLPLLVTARQRYPGLKRLDVGRLKRKDAVSLLSHHALLNLNLEQDAEALCDLLGDHAFALRIAGITLATNKLEPVELIAQIKDNPHAMKVPPDFAEAGKESVSALLSVSARALGDPAYEALLAFGTVFTSNCTPELLSLCTRRTEEETEDALRQLQERGLAERQAEPGSDTITYRLHDLIYSFAKANAYLRDTTAMQACYSFLKKHQHDFDMIEIEIRNILEGAQVALKQDAIMFVNFIRHLVLGNAYYQARGHSPISLKLLERAAEQAKSFKDFETAHYLLARLADTFREHHQDYKKAYLTYQEALHLAVQIENDLRQATILSLMGIVSFHLGLENAEDFLERGHTIAVKHKDQATLSQILEHKGYVAGQKGNYSLAHSCLLESAFILRMLISQSLPKTKDLERRLFFTLLNLGEAERKLDHFAEALKFRLEALEIAQKYDNQILIAYALQELGEMYHGAQRKDLAQEHFDKALELYLRNNNLADIEALIITMKNAGYTIKDAYL